MSRQVLNLTVGADEDGVRLDRWFRRRWPHLGQAQVQKLVRSGQVRVDGARAKAEQRLAAGETVRVPPLPEAGPPPDAGLSDADRRFVRSLVIYEDDLVIALDKPSGLAVQGGTKTHRHIDRLLSAWGEGTERPRLVHRLDRDTSGVLLLGKTPAAAAKLAGAFAHRQARKTYWALVAGSPHPASGIIELPLAKRGVGDREMMIPVEAKDPGAELAVSEYVTLSRAGQKVAWLALRPRTGRTHQLRAHMKAIGHPILGDPKYGDEASAALSQGIGLQLHARRLDLPHPKGGRLVVEAPLGAQMREGFDMYGFHESEADEEPFAPPSRRR